MVFDRIAETRKWIERFRNVTESNLVEIERTLIKKRIAWFAKHRTLVKELNGDDVEKAYRLLLLKFDIDEEEAPIVGRTEKRIVFHSKNFCPSLEACRILGLDTKYICKAALEKPADILIKQLNPKLKFSRNYDRIRPCTSYCEEMISFV